VCSAAGLSFFGQKGMRKLTITNGKANLGQERVYLVTDRYFYAKAFKQSYYKGSLTSIQVVNDCENWPLQPQLMESKKTRTDKPRG